MCFDLAEQFSQKAAALHAFASNAENFHGATWLSISVRSSGHGPLPRYKQRTRFGVPRAVLVDLSSRYFLQCASESAVCTAVLKSQSGFRRRRISRRSMFCCMFVISVASNAC